MCHCHRGIRQEPLQDIPALSQQLDLPSALFTLHPGWDFLICNVLLSGGRGNGMNWTDCELANRCCALPHLGCLSGIRLAAAPARGTEDRRDTTRTCPATTGPPEGAPACFPQGGNRVGLWGPELRWPPLASVFPKVPLTQAPW